MGYLCLNCGMVCNMIIALYHLREFLIKCGILAHVGYSGTLCHRVIYTLCYPVSMFPMEFVYKWDSIIDIVTIIHRATMLSLCFILQDLFIPNTEHPDRLWQLHLRFIKIVQKNCILTMHARILNNKLTTPVIYGILPRSLPIPLTIGQRLYLSTSSIHDTYSYVSCL